MPMSLAMQMQMQMAYGAYNDMQMGNAPMNLMPSPFMPNMMSPFAYMGNMQQGPVNNNPFLMAGHQAPGQQMPNQQMPPPWQNASQTNTQETQIKRQRSASQASDHHANTDIATQNIAAHALASTASPPASPERNASPERDAGPGSVSSGLHESVWNLTAGGDFISPTSAVFPASDMGGHAPFQGLGRLSEEPDAEQKVLFDSQNTKTDSFGRSTQDSFGSTVQGSHVTPAQPRPAADDGAQEDIQD